MGNQALYAYKIYLIFLLVGMGLSRTNAQPFDSKIFRAIDKYAKNTPEEATHSIESLAKYLTAEAPDQLNQVRAFYIWIANNISYDDTAFFDGQQSYQSLNLEHEHKQEALEVLHNRTAVCVGYTHLFKALCQQINITAEVVTGHCKDSKGKLADMLHAWNVVKIDNQWYMLDPTWGAGALDTDTKRYIRQYNDFYFLQAKEIFLQTHFPDDPLWQLSNLLIAESEFVEEWETRISYHPFFNSEDSLKRWEQQNEEDRKIASAYRIIRFYPFNRYGILMAYNDCIHKANKQITEINELLQKLANHRELNADNCASSLNKLERNIILLERYFFRLDSLSTSNPKPNFSKAHKQISLPIFKAMLAISHWRLESLQLPSLYERDISKKITRQIEADLQHLQNSHSYLLTAQQQLSLADPQDTSIQELAIWMLYYKASESAMKGVLYLDMGKSIRYEHNLSLIEAYLDSANRNIQFAKNIQQHLSNSQNVSSLSEKFGLILDQLSLSLPIWEYEIDQSHIDLLNIQLVAFINDLYDNPTSKNVIIPKTTKLIAKAEIDFETNENKWIASDVLQAIKVDSIELYQQLISRFYVNNRIFLMNKAMFLLCQAEISLQEQIIPDHFTNDIQQIENALLSAQKIPLTYTSQTEIDTLDIQLSSMYINLLVVNIKQVAIAMEKQVEEYEKFTSLSQWDEHKKELLLSYLQSIENLYQQKDKWINNTRSSQKNYLESTYILSLGYANINLQQIYRHLFHLSFNNYTAENFPTIKNYLNQVLHYLDKAEEQYMKISFQDSQYTLAQENLQAIRQNRKELNEMLREIK